MSDLEHPALEVLYEFFAQCDAWERECIDKHESKELFKDDNWEQHKEKLTDAFVRFCEAGRNAERLQDKGSYSLDYPEHHEEKVTQVLERNGKVIIQTLSPRLQGIEYRYEMVMKDGQYLLRDRRQMRFVGKEKWSRDML